MSQGQPSVRSYQSRGRVRDMSGPLDVARGTTSAVAVFLFKGLRV